MKVKSCKDCVFYYAEWKKKSGSAMRLEHSCTHNGVINPYNKGCKKYKRKE